MNIIFVLFHFFNFSELLPAFILANKIGNLIFICFGVNIFNPCPCCSVDFSSISSSLSSEESDGKLGLIIIFLTSS